MSVTGTPRMVATQTALGGSSGTGAGRPRPNHSGRRLVPTSETGGAARRKSLPCRLRRGRVGHVFCRGEEARRGHREPCRPRRCSPRCAGTCACRLAALQQGRRITADGPDGGVVAEQQRRDLPGAGNPCPLGPGGVSLRRRRGEGRPRGPVRRLPPQGRAASGASSRAGAAASASRPSRVERSCPSRTPSVKDASRSAAADVTAPVRAVRSAAAAGGPSARAWASSAPRAMVPARRRAGGAFLTWRLAGFHAAGHRGRVGPAARRLQQLDGFQGAPRMRRAVNGATVARSRPAARRPGGGAGP